MQTIKALKKLAILSGIYCFCSITFVICIILNPYCTTDAVTIIGAIATFGWMLNPTPIISFVNCLSYYSIDRRSTETKQLIGKKRFWIYIWPIITTLFYFIAAAFFIEHTGGV